jgi:hypothetical protein
VSDDDGPHTPILAESSLCTVLRSDDGFVYIQIGYVIVRLPERDVASLAGTLNKVVRQLFPRTIPRERVELRVIQGGPDVELDDVDVDVDLDERDDTADDPYEDRPDPNG